ncbi:hypothetical protein [Seonamhaeicola sp.]|uniref:hypothetical protein n=1 Tax=Seonamhaeicola sp. TaxID=1912245 RepID=UPI0035666B70
MKSILSSMIAVLLALMASTCCVGPLLALAGMLGASVSQLVWLASIKPYLVAFSLIAISYNLYRAYFPKKEQACCTIDHQEVVSKLDTKQKKSLSFLQSKTFLWGIAIITLIILILPYI